MTAGFAFMGLVVTTIIGLRQDKDKAIKNLETVSPLALLLGSGICLFSIACGIGVFAGKATNALAYPSFSDVLVKSALDREKLSATDYWRCHLIYWELQAKGRSRTSIEEFFRVSVAPVLSVGEAKRTTTDSTLTQILTELRSVTPSKTMIADEPFDRNPTASVTFPRQELTRTP